MITRVQLLSLPVRDQDRARDFYVEVLGMDLIRDSQEADTRWVQVAPKGAATSITLLTWFASMPPGSVKGTVLQTDDLDGDLAALTARGLPITGGIQDAPWGRYVTFDDPDGNGIVLQPTAPTA